MRLLILFLLCTCCSIPTAFAAEKSLKAFESDGCTMFVDGPPHEPKKWAHCCFEHDLRYWFGGTVENQDFSDLQLKACVKEVAGSNWASIIYRGVRSGHHSPIKSKYKWSWGWSPSRLGEPLSLEEKELIKARLQQMPLDHQFRENFIARYLL
jgi:hypothetical protein